MVDAQLAILAAIEADTSGTNVVKTGSFDRDYSLDAGETRIAGEYTRVIGFRRTDSNTLEVIIGTRYEMAHRLANPFSEEPYTGSPDLMTCSVLDCDLAVLLDRNWWKAIQYVVNVEDNIERGEIERVGHVLVYSVDAQVSVDLTGL